MKLKQKKENYLLQVGHYVYDYKHDDGTEKIIVADENDLEFHSIYYYANEQLTLAYTNMPDSAIKANYKTLSDNCPLILKMGRETKI